MTQQEAVAYLDGFTSGAIFFACSPETFKSRPHVMDKIKAEVRAAHARIALGKPDGGRG